MLRVDEGNTITDFDEEEVQRKVSISTAIAVAEWKKFKINVLDTPGYNIFINDTRAALVAADSALVIVDGVAGVEVQTEKVWKFSSDYNLPRAFVINKLDRERSSFERALESIQEAFARYYAGGALSDDEYRELRRRILGLPEAPRPAIDIEIPIGKDPQGEPGR